MVKRTAHRFANMEYGDYQCLTADAEGTTDFPRAGMVVDVAATTADGGVILRKGRYDIGENRIILFPTRAVLTTLLTSVSAEGVVPMLFRGEINGVSEDMQARFRTRPSQEPVVPVEPLQELTTALADMGIVVRSSQGQAIFEHIEEQIASGELVVPTIKAREERSIEL